MKQDKNETLIDETTSVELLNLTETTTEINIQLSVLDGIVSEVINIGTDKDENEMLGSDVITSEDFINVTEIPRIIGGVIPDKNNWKFMVIKFYLQLIDNNLLRCSVSVFPYSLGSPIGGGSGAVPPTFPWRASADPIKLAKSRLNSVKFTLILSKMM